MALNWPSTPEPRKGHLHSTSHKIESYFRANSNLFKRNSIILQRCSQNKLVSLYLSLWHTIFNDLMSEVFWCLWPQDHTILFSSSKYSPMLAYFNRLFPVIHLTIYVNHFNVFTLINVLPVKSTYVVLSVELKICRKSRPSNVVPKT